MSSEQDLHLAEPTGDAEQAPSPEPEYEGIPEEILQRRREALKMVRQFGDPILRSEARTISDFGPDLLADAERMVSLMHDAMGIGLAAPQVGSSRRLLVYQVGDQRPVALANPVIEWASDLLEPADEGCLSLPSVEVEVERSVFVRVRAQDVFGDEIKVEASGVEARVIQHEMDHLDGVLIIDRASRDQRKAALKALREAEADSGFAA